MWHFFWDCHADSKGLEEVTSPGIAQIPDWTRNAKVSSSRILANQN
jgi:hypothetical protein